MTVKEALIASVNYPLSEKNVMPQIIIRGLQPDTELTEEVGHSKGYRLAYADTLRYVVTMVNLSQGGSVTMPNAKVLAGTANAIYREYGEPLIGEAADTISTLKNGTNDW